LASRLGTSNGPDWQDVTRAALDYAETWGGAVTIHLRPYGTQKDPRMTVVASLYADQAAVGVLKPLASASVALPGGTAGGTSAAALLALYELDKEIYRREIGLSPIGG